MVSSCGGTSAKPKETVNSTCDPIRGKGSAGKRRNYSFVEGPIILQYLGVSTRSAIVEGLRLRRS